MIVIGIDEHLEPVGIRGRVVATPEARHDSRWIGVPHPGPDVESLVINQNPNIGALGGGSALIWIELREVESRGRAGPIQLV